jgi:hypothetical protein
MRLPIDTGTAKITAAGTSDLVGYFTVLSLRMAELRPVHGVAGCESVNSRRLAQVGTSQVLEASLTVNFEYGESCSTSGWKV